MMLDESRVQPERRSDAEARDPRPDLGAKRRVLIADDHRDWTDALAAFLEDEGYSVRTAYDGVEALDAAHDFEPQVVVLDIRMPRLGGYAAARFFKARPAPQRPVLIAITAWAGEYGKQQAQASGFDHYLVKPADPATILDLLKNI